MRLRVVRLALAGLVAAAASWPQIDPQAVDLPATDTRLAAAGRPGVTGEDAPDPHTVRDGDTYYAYTTNRPVAGGALVNVPVLRSTDLATWELVADALPQLGAWALPGNTWAPTVVEADGGWVLFYTARHRASGRQCIGRALADEPTGPFTDGASGPALCDLGGGGSIDPYVFTDRDGSKYLYWKNDGNCCGMWVFLWGRPLDSLARPTGTASVLVVHDRAWERPLIENPAMTRSPDRQGRYRLFYSANWWASDRYATGYASCASPLGPCTKVTTAGPWHDTTPHARGPGGTSFFTDTGGRNWMAYHAWPNPPGTTGYASSVRTLFVEKANFAAGGVSVRPAYPYQYHDQPPHPFVDVDPWVEGAVTWISTDPDGPGGPGAPLASGYDDGPDQTFRPNAQITRAEASRMIHRLEGSPPASGRHGFTDVPPWIEGAVDWLAVEGHMTGWPDGTFRPGSPMTRAQLARLLYRNEGEPASAGDCGGMTDVAPWAAEAICWLVDEGYATGWPDRTFRPTLPITRGQVAAMLFRLEA